MTTTVNALFNTYADAALAVSDLKAAGIPEAEISILANNVERQEAESDRVDNNMAETGAADGAAVGGVLGGTAGLLAGLGALTIPGIGPVIGAGWLLTTAVGAAVGASGGGVIGALIGAGVTKDDAEIFVEGVRRGGTLVSARVGDDEVPDVEAIMAKYNGVDRTGTPYGSQIVRETVITTPPPAI
jgi:hypothetical protein